MMIDPDEALARLHDERTSATELLASLAHDFIGIVDASAGSNADDEHDPEGSTIAFERSQISTLIDQTRQRLTQIDAATARVHAGTYGTCEVCGRPIPRGRLEARPTATTCITCA
jgi:DnaK suppressor protein